MCMTTIQLVIFSLMSIIVFDNCVCIFTRYCMNVCEDLKLEYTCKSKKYFTILSVWKLKYTYLSFSP